jgi:hypothetical protein
MYEIVPKPLIGKFRPMHKTEIVEVDPYFLVDLYPHEQNELVRNHDLLELTTSQIQAIYEVIHVSYK